MEFGVRQAERAAAQGVEVVQAFEGGYAGHFVGSVFHVGEVKLMADRDIDDPRHGHAVGHEGDVDRELSIALDEFFRPVERVDYPERAPRPAFVVGDVASFLAQDGIGRRAEQVGDDVV